MRFERACLVNARLIAGLLALCAVVGLAFATIMQYAIGHKPCLLCITQRYELIAVGLFAAIGFFCARRRWALRLGLALSALFALFGAITAGWQIYLQTYPPESAECSPGFDYLLANLPLTEFLPTLFSPYSDCATRSYVIYLTEGWLTIPQVSLAGFIVLLLCALYAILQSFQDNSRQIFR